MAKRKLVLDVWERITLIDIMGQIRGDLRLLRKAGKVLDALEMTDEEKEEVGLREPRPGVFGWDDEDAAFTIRIRDKEAAGLLKRTVEQYQGFTARERERVEKLCAALGIEVEDDEDEEEDWDDEEEEHDAAEEEKDSPAKEEEEEGTDE